MATATNNLDNYFTLFADGIDPVLATGPHKKLQVEGIWEEDDTIQLTVRYNSIQHDLGSKDITQAIVTFAIAFRNQVMVCASDKIYFSGLDNPTGWETKNPGYGYITVSGERGDALEALALAPYAMKLAVFARNNIQLWQPDPEPKNWQLIQTLENVGTCSPKSVVSYGELDVFFLSDSGIRSLRARESTDLVNVHDVGTPIDVYVQRLLEALSEKAKLELVSAFYSTRDGRYWLFLGPYTFVFSYFPGSKVSAWSMYTQEYWNYIAGEKYSFFPLWIAFKNGTLYLLDPGASGSGDARTLGKYPGGETAPEPYYHSQAVIIVPFIDAKQPATKKLFTGIDIIGKGTWKVEVGDNPNDITSYRTLVAALPLSTVNWNRIPLSFRATHLMVRLSHTANETATIGKVILHFNPQSAT
jgi:hypothetical protein